MEKTYPIEEYVNVDGNVTISQTKDSISYSVESGQAFAYKLINEKDYDVNTESTSEIDVGTIEFSDYGKIAFEGLKMFLITVRDKNGKRKGYFYGSDTLVIKSARSVVGYSISASSGNILIRPSSAYGVYAVAPSSASTSGVPIKARYNSTNSLTINGKFNVKIYSLEWPENKSPLV